MDLNSSKRRFSKVWGNRKVPKGKSRITYGFAQKLPERIKM
jgi:hypothetical protein